MPTYDYKCSACGHEFEKFQSITARPVKVCPSCGERKVRRLVGSGAGVIFRGSGFYQTDYRSESYKRAAEKDKKAASGGESGTKAEKKSSAAAESGSGGEKKASSTGKAD